MRAKVHTYTYIYYLVHTIRTRRSRESKHEKEKLRDVSKTGQHKKREQHQELLGSMSNGSTKRHGAARKEGTYLYEQRK